MDKSTFRHRMTVAPVDEWNFHAFVRGDDGTIEHYHPDQDTEVLIFGPEDLGGSFDTDPIAAWYFGEGVGELHLIGRSGTQLVDWVWDNSGAPGMLGQPRVVRLPGFAVADPEVIGTAGRIDVFAPSLDGPLRHWFLLSPADGWQGPEVMTPDSAGIITRPCAVSRTTGSFDVFAIDTDNAGLRHWFNDEDGWHSEPRSHSAAGRNLVGTPTAVSYEEQRLDVFVLRRDGVPVHWGWNGRWFDEEERLGSPGVLEGDLILLTTEPKRMTLVARAPGTGGRPHVVFWDLEPGPPAFWRDSSWSAARFPVSAWRAGEQQWNLLTRGEDGSLGYDRFVRDDSLIVGGNVVQWAIDEGGFTRTEPVPPPESFTPAVVEPDLVARRPEDLVLLGVRWDDRAEVVAGPPAELLAHAGAELTITLPPQHVAEEVVAADGPVMPLVDPQLTGGVAVWGASASGPSRVVVALDEGTRVALTVEGVLEALRRGTLSPSADATDPHTQLELPFRLLMTPLRDDGTDITFDHPSRAVPGPNGAVGLWNTRVAAAGADPAAPAGLTLRPLGADSEDPFRTSLSGGSRARILREEPTARIDRLRLSALGATFTVSGSWPTFEWDHRATLGRDHRVRTAARGVLYPFGHRAVYVETSERHLETTRQGAVAHLRTRSVLLITEPARQLVPSPAFPFGEVRFQRTQVDFTSDPAFETVPLPAPGTDALSAARSQLFSVVAQLRPTIDGGDLGPAPGAPPVEDIALDQSDPPRADAALRYLDTWVELQQVADQVAALEAGGALSPVEVFFVPGGDAPIRFPVTLVGSLGEVHVDIPVVFVADVRMPEGLLHPAYSSLEDPDVHRRVADAYRGAGDGVVAISPARIDMVLSGDRQAEDTPEVHRLHVVGEPADGGFAARLGTRPAAGESVPPADRWAFEMSMTELGTLVGHQTMAGPPTLPMALTPELLSGVPEPGLLFRTPADVEALTVAFSRNSARSGGLAAPDLNIDGVSRGQGPVQAASFLDQVSRVQLDPGKFLGQAASLLGFTLADLIDAQALQGSPVILADPRPGQPPKVTMTWSNVPLRTTEGRFVTSDDSSLDLEVTIAPEGQRVRCTVENVTLAFPEREDPPKLLEVTFGRVEFLQEGSGAPSLHVSDVKPTFFGFLRLLDDLQGAMKFDGAAPAIHASDRGVTATFDLPVPDLPTVTFQLTGLSFHSVIDVPFDGRPVTIELAFASREDPFNVSILGLGGGGYVDLMLDSTGLRRLEIALEFGASLEVDFVVATGEVHVMGGIRVVDDDGFSLAGYLRFGGMVEVLGLVSVSVELVVTLTYDMESRAMVGRVRLVLELDLRLFSDSVELDSGDWVLFGDATPADERLAVPPRDLRGFGADLGLEPTLGVPVLGTVRAHFAGVDPDAWRRYRSAFDEEALP